MLEQVKANLGITGTYQDTTIQGYIDEVKQYLLDGGVDKSIVNSTTSIGVITRGVADLWNYGSGGTTFSPYFIQRATQLAFKSVSETPTYQIAMVKDYLFEMNENNLDYDHAYKYFKEMKPSIVGGCSSIRNGNWYGRNFDWTYDENAQFIVRTPRKNGLIASIGMSGVISGLTNDFVKSEIESDLYKIVPFMLVDGINEFGVVANTNVVPLDKGTTTKTIPRIEEKFELCSLMLVRYILDHFTSAKNAVEYIQNYVSVYMPTSLLEMNYEVHLMVADTYDTYLIEFVGNEIVVSKMDKPYMTNFYLNDVVFNEDGKVYTPIDGHKPSEENNITTNGSGLERYNLIVDNYASCNSKNGMRELLDALKYTNAYINGEWCTEFVGINDLTVDSEVGEFTDVMKQAKTKFDSRVRNGETWNTKHSSIYDISQRKLYVVIQEDEEELEVDI